jgi:hypothetical protein
LPNGFAFRVKWSRNIMVIIGSIFFLVGGLMLAATLAAKAWIAVFPGLFCLGGFFMFLNGRKTAHGILHAFRNGIAVPGEIAEVSVDTTQSINDRHPWRLVYHFPVDGQEHEGVLTSFDSTIATRSRGQPVWVLYVPEDLEQNTLYPPLR